MKRFVSIISIFMLSTLIVSQSSCKKENDEEIPEINSTDFSVSLKSSEFSRADYQSVFLDIQKVSIHTSSDSSESAGWFDLETNVGIYDLLDYMAGNDTILGFDPVMDTQTISQVRLMLGNNNTVVIDGETHELKTPSAQSSGIKIQVHAQLQPNMSFKLVLDFDPQESIHKMGNGGINDFDYILKPVIRASLVQL